MVVDIEDKTWKTTVTDRASIAIMARFRELYRLFSIKHDELNIAISNQKILINRRLYELKDTEDCLLGLYKEYIELYDSIKVIQNEMDSYQISS